MANGWNALDADSHLKAIEALAEHEGLIASEEELSERFDSDVLPGVIAAYSEDDGPALREAFNNWTDSLTKEGDLHPLQYESYCYVGTECEERGGAA